MNIHIYIYTYLYIHIYIYIHVCACVCVYTCRALLVKAVSVMTRGWNQHLARRVTESVPIQNV